MAKTKIPSPKKQARLQVIAQLQTALPGLEETLGKKEFNSRLKKAAKILTEGIKVKVAKKEVKIKQEKAA
ncbi:MAG TPA: hypothetical protein VHN59_16235 [Chitinophagaceae bacterium]|nr:hypothetical protein [Chitinophagaceae bacterium]